MYLKFAKKNVTGTVFKQFMININYLYYSLSFDARKLLWNNDGQIQKHEETCCIWKKKNLIVAAVFQLHEISYDFI